MEFVWNSIVSVPDHCRLSTLLRFVPDASKLYEMNLKSKTAIPHLSEITGLTIITNINKYGGWFV